MTLPPVTRASSSMHLRPGRPAELLGRGPLHEERGLERRPGLLAEQRDLVAARLLGRVPAGELAPLVAGRGEADQLRTCPTGP